MRLSTSAGWRRLALIAFIVLGPIELGVIGFAIVNIHGFMYSPWAFWVLIVCLFVPYSIAYTADILRRREARGAETYSGDSSALVFPSLPNSPSQGEEKASSASSSRSSATWIWVCLALVAAYAAVRLASSLANGVELDWTTLAAVVVVACLAVIMPSAIAWQRFQRSVASLPDALATWPAFRTDQFAAELHQNRPGATIPQDLILVATGSAVNVWTNERAPRLLLSLPRDPATTVRATIARDRLGSTGVRLERHSGIQVEAFELVVRRKGIFTYFRTSQETAERFLRELSTQAR